MINSLHATFETPASPDPTATRCLIRAAACFTPRLLLAALAVLLLGALVACAPTVGHPDPPEVLDFPITERARGKLAVELPEFDPIAGITTIKCEEQPQFQWTGMMVRAESPDGPVDLTILGVDADSHTMRLRGDGSLIRPGSQYIVFDYRPYVVDTAGTTQAGPTSTATVQQLQDQLQEQAVWFSEYRLQYEDSFSIKVLNHDEWSTRVTVLRDGNIYFGYFRSDDAEDHGDGTGDGTGDGNGGNGGNGNDRDDDGLAQPDDPPGAQPPPAQPDPAQPGAQPEPQPGAQPQPDQPQPQPGGTSDADVPAPGRPLRVIGLTISEVQERIVAGLRKYFYDPQIKIEDIVQSPNSYTVKVLGALNRPGRVKIQAGYRLVDALADAGGVLTRTSINNVSDLLPLLPLVDWRKAVVAREARFLPAGTCPESARPNDLYRLEIDFRKLVEGDTSQNIPLFPGDLIQVPAYEAQNTRLTVACRVNAPGVYYYRERIDLVEALARAGWMDEDAAKVGGVYLVRNSIAPDGQRELYVLNPINVARGTARNVPLRDGDIVYVDSTTLHDVSTAMGKLSGIISGTSSPANVGNAYRNLFTK